MVSCSQIVIKMDILELLVSVVYVVMSMFVAIDSNPLCPDTPNNYSPAAYTQPTIKCQYSSNFSNEIITKVCPKGYYILNSTHCSMCSLGVYLNFENRCKSCLLCDRCYPDQPWKNLKILSECKPDQKGTCQCTDPNMYYDNYDKRCFPCPIHTTSQSLNLIIGGSKTTISQNTIEEQASQASLTSATPPPERARESPDDLTREIVHYAIHGISALLLVVFGGCILRERRRTKVNKNVGEHGVQYIRLPTNDHARGHKAAGKKVIEEYEIRSGTSVIIFNPDRDHIEADIQLSTDISKRILGPAQPILVDGNLKDVNSKIDSILSGDLGDAFVCFLLGHGDKKGTVDGLILKEDSFLRLDILETKLSKCKQLVENPKIIVYTCCRGANPENAVTLVNAAGKGGTEPDGTEPDVLPNTGENADFLISFASAHGTSMDDAKNVIRPGKAAYFDKTGSQFLLALKSCMETCGPNEDLVSILTQVNKLIGRKTVTSEETGEPVKAQPTFTSTLHKKIFPYCPEETTTASEVSSNGGPSTSNGTVAHR